MVASLVGPVTAVVAGGVGTIFIVLLSLKLFPALGRLRKVEAPPEARPMTPAGVAPTAPLGESGVVMAATQEAATRSSVGPSA
jgi:hypothetical protein